MAAILEDCFVINMAFRHGRLVRFNDRIADVWPLSPIQRFEAIRGNLETPPMGWKPSQGAWGAFLSHRQVISLAATNGRATMVFEDDAVPRHGSWVPEMLAFLKEVPDDWDMIHLGGQMFGEPKQATKLVWRARRVNKAHAYAVSATGARKLLSHLVSGNSQSNNHVDYQFQEFHKIPEVNVYIPRRWFFGQGAGETDVSFRGGSQKERRFWDW